MAVAPQAVPGAPAPAKAKRNRSPSVAKEAYFIIQIVDENGQPIEFDKKRVRIVSIEREAKNVLDLVETTVSCTCQHTGCCCCVVRGESHSAPHCAALSLLDRQAWTGKSG